MVLETILLYSLGASIVALGGGITAGLHSELESRDATRNLIKMSRERRLAKPKKSTGRRNSPDSILFADTIVDESESLRQRYGLIMKQTRSLDEIPVISVDSCGDIVCSPSHDRHR